MVQALAPRGPRGGSCVWLSFVLLGMAVAVAEAQTTKGTGAGKAAAKSGSTKAAETSKATETPAAKRKESSKAEEGKEAPQVEDRAPTAPDDPRNKGGVEVFKDPRADAILQKTKNRGYRALGRAGAMNLPRLVSAMSVNEMAYDDNTVRTFVNSMINDLTSTSNIQALLDAELKGAAARKSLSIQQAVDHLLAPLENARKVKNNGFITSYTKILLAFLPPLLDNNLYARLEAMIVLANTGSQDAIKIFTKQLGDPNQTVWVKLWAAKGICRVTEDGTRELPTALAVESARAVASWMEKEKDMPWPALVRALDALGSLRLAFSPDNPSKPEFALIAMQYLTDPKARPEVRAHAAWALGMMRVTPAVSKYNFALVAYYVGALAAEFGEMAGAAFDVNPGLTEHFTGLVLYQLIPSLEGVEGARESGLLHVPGNHPKFDPPTRTLVQKLDGLIKPVARASVDLLRSSKGQIKNRKQELSSGLAGLRAFLDKNAPSDKKLVPNGPDFPVKNEEVAEAEADARR